MLKNFLKFFEKNCSFLTISKVFIVEGGVLHHYSTIKQTG